MGTAGRPAYDAYADWYEGFISGGGDYLRRVHATVTDLLGAGEGSCLDICCGTGAHASVPAGLGWTPVGVDLSGGQLRHARGRLPVARGVHPCFVGAFADWGHHPSVVVDERYADRSRSFDSWNTSGVRVRVGAWHLPLADLVNATVAAGLRLVRVVEAGPGGVPDLFGLLALRDR
ncbi:SAM-dependent methyltransferase [Micromonospora noduli]|uniref:SAM-dependent methyltransferase n=1 Tax=Micromonospora noduli TaxID=709876 RepID=UPI00342CA097